MNKKIMALTVAFLAVVGALAWFFLFHQGPPTLVPLDKPPIKIGAVLALTGSAANYGQSLRQGLEIAKAEINDAGGIDSRPLEIIYEDSRAEATAGVSAFTKLSSIDRVPLVVGSISSVILAMAPMADRNHVVLLNSSAISPKICEEATGYLFSIMVSGAQEAEFAAKALAGGKEEEVAIIFSNNSSGIDTKDKFTKYFVAAGGRIIASEGYDLGATDFRTQLAKIKSAGAKAVYLIAFSSQDFANVLRQSQELGLRVQWYSYSGFETKETLALAGPAAEGVVYSYPKVVDVGRMDEFRREYQERYNSWPDIYTVTSYDGLHLVRHIIDKNGPSAQGIRGGLRSTQGYRSIFGDVSFVGKQCVDRKLIWKTVSGGAYSILEE